MYTPVPAPSERMTILATRITAIAHALHALKDYRTTEPMLDGSPDEQVMLDRFVIPLFDLYQSHVADIEHEFHGHMRQVEQWHLGLQDSLIPFTSHLGPMKPANERKPIAPRDKGHPLAGDAPAWTKTQEELDREAEAELDRVIGNGVTI